MKVRALAVVVASLALACTASFAGATQRHVSIKNFSFNPVDLSVKVGNTVVWSNDEAAATVHTATSNDGHTFDSGALNPGDSYPFTFTRAGSYPYFCSAHPQTMKGTITVTGSDASPTPSQSHSSSPHPTSTQTVKKSAASASPTASASTSSTPTARGTAAQPSPSRTGRAIAAPVNTGSSGSSSGGFILAVAIALLIVAGTGVSQVIKRRNA
ncbi:MAG: plastocyanin/azurin family copper-binding protein [Actinomycetota bacterium]